MTQNDTMKTPQEIAREQAEVMMAFADGKKIEKQYRRSPSSSWLYSDDHNWNWEIWDYRIKPEPPKAEVTPGEWYWDESTNDVVTNSDVIGDTICCPPEWPESQKYWPANRHLLAAAKDLRDALREIVTLAEVALMVSHNELYEKARKALAKAKGEPHE